MAPVLNEEKALCEKLEMHSDRPYTIHLSYILCRFCATNMKECRKI